MSSKIISLLALFLVITPPLANAQQSLGEAARKAREQKKHAPKAKKIFTNDDLPADPDSLSIVGTRAPEKLPGNKPEETNAKETAGASQQKMKKDEAYWRTRFAEAREKLQLAQKELDILQRELNLLEMQYYTDPNEALRQQYSRSDINLKRQKIEEKQKEVQALQQALSDLTDELRRAGGDPGWAE